MILLDKIKFSNAQEFEKKVRNISDLLQINPDWLMMMMWLESGLNPKSVNKQPGDSSNAGERAAKRATGLTQFMPSTARNFGTSTTALYNMTALQQLDYVYKYFKPYAGKINSLFDLYLINFFPVAMGKPDTYVLETKNISASVIAKQNPGMDINKDGKITIGEFKQMVTKRIPAYVASVFNAEKKNGQLAQD